MTEVSLAWLLTKVISPIVGATKFHHIEAAVKSLDLELTEDEVTKESENISFHIIIKHNNSVSKCTLLTLVYKKLYIHYNIRFRNILLHIIVAFFLILCVPLEKTAPLGIIKTSEVI